MPKKLPKQKVNQFLFDLSQKYKVFVPILNGQIYEFGELNDDSVFNLFEPTYTSFKKILLPQSEKLYEFSNDNFSRPRLDLPVAIIGLSASDLEALGLLGQIMTEPIADQPFLTKLGQALLVATTVGLKKNLEVDIGEMPGSYDLLIVQADEEFLIDFGSQKGKQILNAFELPKSGLSIKKSPLVEFGLFKDKEKIVKALELSRDSKIWQQLAKTCLGCGNCSAICPLCYCFDIEHEFSNQKNCGSCNRRWDSCFYKSFAQTSGHNFRELLEDRIYHFFEHKFIQAYQERKQFNCNHCGRCVTACPVNINIFKVLDEVIKNYEKEYGK